MKYDLDVRNVTKKFGEFEAVKKVSFTVEEGKFFSILKNRGQALYCYNIGASLRGAVATKKSLLTPFIYILINIYKVPGNLFSYCSFFDCFIDCLKFVWQNLKICLFLDKKCD